MRAALLLIATFCRHQLAAATSPCESLASVAVPNGMITLAETVAAGAFKPPANNRAADGGRTPDYSGLPAFCRVQASLKPSADSDIRRGLDASIDVVEFQVPRLGGQKETDSR